MIKAIDYKKIFYCFIVIIFILNYFLFLIINSNNLDNLISNVNNTSCLENSYQNSLSNKYEYELNKSEISIFSNDLNIKCLNKFYYEIENDGISKITYFFSSKFTGAVFTFSNFFLLLFCILIGKSSNYYFLGFLLNFLQIITFNQGLYNESFLIEVAILYLVNIFIFYNFCKISNVNNLFFIFTFVLIFFLFNNYNFFSNILFFYFLYFFYLQVSKKEINVMGYYNLVTYIPIVYYSIKYLSGLSIKSSLLWKNYSNDIYESGKIFGDLQLIFRSIGCNVSYFEQEFKFNSGKLNCPFETGYPAVDYNFAFQLNNIWLAVMIAGIVTLIISNYIYQICINKYKKYSYLLFLITLSSPVNFIFDRLNLDILVFFLIWVSFKNYSKHPILANIILLFLFSLKIYPIFAIICILLIELKSKDIRKIIFSSTSILLGSIYLYDIVFIKASRLTATNNPNELFSGEGFFNNDSITFGFLAHFKLLKNHFSQISILVFYLLLFIFSYFLFNKIKKNFEKLNMHEILYFTLFCGTFFMVGLFENFDYRLCMLILIFPMVMKISNNVLSLLYFSTFFTSASVFIFFNKIFVTLNVIVVSTLLQIFLFVFLSFFRNDNKENFKFKLPKKFNKTLYVRS